MMSGHLCLKWNNHSLAFLKSISTIQIKEKYCDATIACQGKYFSVHRVILSTCSDYFDEIFERMECPHPYIIFKDIDPEEMELLLNYMYQGEVNVIQEKLPSLIKAAEALKVKGLAIPDDLPSQEGSQTNRKRKATSIDNSEAKRKTDESRRSRRSSHTSETDVVNEHESSDRVFSERLKDSLIQNMEGQQIKAEPLEPSDFESSLKVTEGSEGGNSFSREEAFFNKDDDKTPFIKPEEPSTSNESFENQSTWPDFANSGSSALPNLSVPEMRSDDICGFGWKWENATAEDQDIFAASTSQYERTEGYLQDDSRKCRFCNYMSTNITALKTHIKSKHFGSYRPYHCPVCPIDFTRKNHLDSHMLIHTGEKPFQCPICERRFTEKSTLTKHMKRKTQCYKKM